MEYTPYATDPLGLLLGISDQQKDSKRERTEISLFHTSALHVQMSRIRAMNDQI